MPPQNRNKTENQSTVQKQGGLGQTPTLTRDDVYNMIDDYFTQNYLAAAPKIPPHQHNGLDNLQIDPSTLLGFTIMNKVPTDQTYNGVIRLYYDGTNYRIYARINNTWVGGTLS